MDNTYLNTGVHTVIIAVISTLFGTMLERFFAAKPDMWVLLQIMLIGIAYHFIREQYQPDPDAWVVFAACAFYAQPTLLPKLKRMLNLF
jgi:hypothetical protein